MKLKSIKKLPDYLRDLKTNIDQLQEAQGDLRKKVNRIEHLLGAASFTGESKKSEAQVGQRFADNHLLDSFYLELENNFRGLEAEIKDRQRVHLKLFTNSKVNFRKYPIVDLGAGRGEFVELLSDNKLRAIGVDLNESMVKRMKEKGREATQDDAIGYLAKAKSGSLGAVSGFHLAEHLPFDQLLTLIGEAHRALAPGGLLLLETPNPENLTVGAFTFHYDPSHLKPIPPAILDFMAKFKGFGRVEILRLQPEMTESNIVKATKDKNLQEIMRRIYGPRDYALLAYK